VDESRLTFRLARYTRASLGSLQPPRRSVVWRMVHIGAWHYFNPADRSTYPKVNSPIEVRDAIGARSEGDFLKLVSDVRRLLKPQITGWRYVRDKAIN
jgi:hypothetical protein